MLVKIIAMGLSPPIWKNVFHHLRNALPKHPFAAGIFSAPEEIEYLTKEFHPHRWRREGVDFLLCESASGKAWKQYLAFLSRLGTRDSFPPVDLVLTLSTLEHGIKQLIQAHGPLALEVDRKLRFTLSDPEFLIRRFPENFPRLRVDGHFSALRVKLASEGPREIAPGGLAANVMLGFSEIDAVVSNGGEAIAPDAWLREVLKAENVKLPRSGSPGLIQEPKGLFLCPGIPMDRITGAVVEGVVFSHLLDLGQLTPNSAHFKSLRDAVRKVGTRHKRRWREVTLQTRIAESKTDFPLVCGGGLELVRETLAALLRARGFRNTVAMESPEDGAFREPALVLQVGPWSQGQMGAQVEDPIVVSLEKELNALAKPLDALLDWRELPFRPLSAPEIPLTPKAFGEQRDALKIRGKKAEDGITLAENRGMLLSQEREVLSSAAAKLTELLEAGQALQVWSGTLPAGVRQVVVFSHDPEEAGAVLQALPGIARKRWFDLSRYTEPDAMGTLSLEPLRSYQKEGLMVITAASREKLKAMQARIAEESAAVEQGLSESRSALAFYRGEEKRIAEGTEVLARQWLRDAMDDWLDRNMDALLGQVEVLRRRHERRWFARALVNRVVMIPSNGDNQEALMVACREVYPGFNPEHSRAVHFEYQRYDALPPAERQALRTAEPGAAQDPGALKAREEEALQALNRGLLDHYLQIISHELEDTKADLVIIEQEREPAFQVLEHLRATAPLLAETPVIVILPDYWAPRENQPLPWPRTRVICLPRLGALTAEDCQRELKALYSS